MKFTLLRAVALLLLLFSSVSLSGVALAVSTLANPGVEDACCGGAETEPATPAPCAAVDCPCSSCLTLELTEPPALVSPAGSPTTASSTLLPYPPGDYVGAIDYPPER